MYCTYSFILYKLFLSIGCSKTSPVFRRVVPISQGLLFLQWSVPSQISSEVERFDISITDLSSRGAEIHRSVGTNVRAFMAHSLARGRKYRVNLRMQIKGELCAPASVVRTI